MRYILFLFLLTSCVDEIDCKFKVGDIVCLKKDTTIVGIVSSTPHEAENLIIVNFKNIGEIYLQSDTSIALK